MRVTGLFIYFFFTVVLLVTSQPQPTPNPVPGPVPAPGPNPQPSPAPGPQPQPSPAPDQPQPIPSVPSPAPDSNLTDPNQMIYDDVELGLKVALIVVGVIWILFGYRLLLLRPHVTLLLAGFIILYFIAFQLLFRFTVRPHYLPTWSAYTLGAVAGLIGATLFFLSTQVGRFFFSAMSGVLFTTLLFTYTPLGALSLAPEYKLAIIGGVGVILGVISIWLNVIVPVIVSSFNGAFIICNAIDNFIKWTPVSNLLVNIMQAETLDNTFDHTNNAFEVNNWKIYIILGAIIIVTIFGVILQYKLTAATQIEEERMKKRKEANDSRDPETSPLLYN